MQAMSTSKILILSALLRDKGGVNNLTAEQRSLAQAAVTESDNVWFSALTHNPAALHLDEDYCQKHTEFGRRLVNSAFTLGLMVEISVEDTTLRTAIASIGALIRPRAW